MPAGRPKAKIDWAKVDKMLQAHCDGVGIAGLLGINYNTLARATEETQKMNFEEYRRLKQTEGKELLRQTMFSNAMKGDKALQIWLSKQYLGMTEKQEVEQTVTTLHHLTKEEADAKRAELRAKLNAES
jgi:hypothetical protein